MSELGWPDQSMGGLRWPTPDGRSYTDEKPAMLEAGECNPLHIQNLNRPRCFYVLNPPKPQGLCWSAES